MRLLREPLVQFIALGAFLFALHLLFSPRPPGRRIDVTASVLDGLRQDHRRRTGALPGPGEEKALVDRFVESEVLYREALAEGLDRGDVIVRRRLVQKMEMISEEAGPARDPTDAELEAELGRDPARYSRPERIAFRHVFIARDHHPDAEGEAERCRARLQRGDDPKSMGDPFLRGHEFAPSTAQEIEAIFGAPFADRAKALAIPFGTGRAPEKDWSAPVPSSFGLHLIQITAHLPGALPRLDQVRAELTRAVVSRRRAEQKRAAIERMRARYEVRLP